MIECRRCEGERDLTKLGLRKMLALRLAEKENRARRRLNNRAEEEGAEREGG